MKKGQNSGDQGLFCVCLRHCWLEATHATIFFFRLFVVAFLLSLFSPCWLWLLLYLVVHKLKRTLAYLILFPLQQSQIKKTLVNIWTLKYERGNSCFHKEGARTINWNKSGGSSKRRRSLVEAITKPIIIIISQECDVGFFLLWLPRGNEGMEENKRETRKTIAIAASSRLWAP